MSLHWSYKRRVGRDVERWREAGYIDDRSRGLILRDVASRGSLIGLPASLAILGATLIGFSAMTFVAANWQEMSKLARILLLMFGMWTAYGAAAVLFSRNLPIFGHAGVLAGAGIFGASIMLVAQMYHMEGNPPDAVLMWAAGAFVSGLAFRSGPALALSMLLVGLWSGWETTLIRGVHWPFLIGWAAVSGAFLWQRWRPGLHLSAAMMAGWIVHLGFKLPHGPHFWLIALIGFGVAAAAMAAEHFHADAFEGRVGAVAPTAANYGLTLGFIGLLLLQFEPRVRPANFAILAIFTLALVIGVMAWAMRTKNPPALRLAYAGFSIEVLGLYFRTLGTLIDTSLFFAMTGVFVIALSALGWRLMKPAVPSPEGARS